MTKTFEITASDVLMGEYKGHDENAAIDAFARDAGYDDYSDLLDRVPGSSRSELYVFEIDADRLFSAVEAAVGESVFQDSYGGGIALVQGESYSTYRELADAFGLDIEQFHA